MDLIRDIFRLCPQYVLPPVIEHVSLPVKSVDKNMARASGGANNMHPLSCAAPTE